MSPSLINHCWKHDVDACNTVKNACYYIVIDIYNNLGCDCTLTVFASACLIDDKQTYIIDQMDEEDLSNTFYTRREYMAFKDAYRLHRDSLGWRREYDGMPCDCDSCMDRIVVDYRMFSPESPPVSPPALSPTSPADFERESPTVYDANEREVGFRCEVDEDGNNDVADETWEDVNAPPSPVISTHGTSEEDDDSDGDEDPVTGQHGGMGHRRTNAWTGDRVSPNVSNAVEKYGEDYAYRRLRLQGFSDRYIRTHFMPEGALANL